MINLFIIKEEDSFKCCHQNLTIIDALNDNNNQWVTIN